MPTDEPCWYAGSRVYPPVAPDTREWRECDHPRQPLGPMVCQCKGCGRGCAGYSVTLPQSEPLVPVLPARPSGVPVVSGGREATVTDKPTKPYDEYGRRSLPNFTGWAYGVTTVHKRRLTLLPRTLQSLRLAGWDYPIVFADGCLTAFDWEKELELPVVPRWPVVRAYGNWMMALWELFVRYPQAERYALFQDDLIAPRNLRAYLDTFDLRDNEYWNLYTTAEVAAQCAGGKPCGWFKTNQNGRGAVALVMPRAAVLTVLGSPHTASRPLHAHKGHRSIDGGVVTALNGSGIYEHCHMPTLVQHIGDESTIGNGQHPKGVAWIGETACAMRTFAPHAVG